MKEGIELYIRWFNYCSRKQQVYGANKAVDWQESGSCHSRKNTKGEHWAIIYLSTAHPSTAILILSLAITIFHFTKQLFLFFFFLMSFINHICQPYKQHLLTLEVKHLKGCIIFQLERQILIVEISKNPVLTCGSNDIGSPAME